MALLTYGDRPVPITPGEDVLSALLAAGIDAPHSCRSGVCQTCLHRAAEGEIPAAAQQGLSEAQKAQGFFLPCVCKPQGPLKVLRIDDPLGETEVEVVAIDRLTPTVVRLRLEPSAPFAHRPGQFLSLAAPDGCIRSYSIVSHPGEQSFLELHVRLLPKGRMSRFVAERLSLGDRLHIRGPFGTCFYDEADRDNPLVLAGAGTGLAPLWGILKDAISRGHRGPIRLYHGAREASGLYLTDELRALARERASFSYIPCVLGASGPAGGDLEAAVLEGEPQPEASSFYLCGGAELVNRVKRALFLRGAKLQRLRSDVFLPAS
jgi:CDP-4-dehydro-6-deoxyglucose reductase